MLVQTIKPVTEAKHCIVLQVGSNAILYDYIAVCWLSIRLKFLAVSVVAKISRGSQIFGVLVLS